MAIRLAISAACGRGGKLYERLSEVSPARRELIRRAFRLLPAPARLRILDAGCGRGGPAVELARLSGGEVVGLDISRRALAALAERVRHERLPHRVHAVHGSLTAMPFADGAFDVVWAEASLHAVGLEAGLAACRRLLAPRGCLVVHDLAWLRPDPPAELARYWDDIHFDVPTVPACLAMARRSGYEVLEHFPVPGEFWWTDYYVPLQSLLHEMRERWAADPVALHALDRHQRAVDVHRAHGAWIGSAYLLMRRTMP